VLAAVVSSLPGPQQAELRVHVREHMGLSVLMSPVAFDTTELTACSLSDIRSPLLVVLSIFAYLPQKTSNLGRLAY
jgi:hypothetical protein